MKNGKRELAFLLCLVMLLGCFPVETFAAETDGLCPHHETHTDCGYVEGESACGYVCDICAQAAEETTELSETEQTKPVCTGLADCAAENHQEGCLKAAAEAATEETTAPCEGDHTYEGTGVCTVCGYVRTITINMTDRGANGWTGNRIYVFIDGVLAHTVTLEDGSSGTWSIPYDPQKGYLFMWGKASDNYSHQQCGCEILLDQQTVFEADYTYFTNCYDGTKLCTICEHAWQDATCTAAKKCDKCLTTEGSALGHTYGEDYKCIRCGIAAILKLTLNTYGFPEDSSVKVHVDGQPLQIEFESAGYVRSWETEYDSGKTYEFYWVKGNNAQYHEVVITLGPDKLLIASQDTCGSYEDGQLIYRICAHNWQDATCTEPKTCSVCSQTTGDALGHDLGQWEVTDDATCTEAGSMSRACSRCEFVETEDIEALGHDYKAVVTAPTCTEEGYTTYTCEVCDDSYQDDAVDALGHTFETYTSNGDATCTADGTKTAKCVNCEVTDTLPDTGSATGHSFGDWAETKAPTCEAKGEERRDCANCDAFETQEVAATGHSFGDWAETKAPGCEAKGEERRDCANCDAFETQEVAATGHDYKAVVIEPTCTEKGNTTHTCANCGDSYQDTFVDALGHSFGNWTQTKAPTLETEGEERRDCANCDAFETREIPVLTHSYKAVITEPTCTQEGYTTYTCETCGDSYRDDVVDALGHTFETYTSDGNATCTADGTKTAKCNNCEATDTVTDTGSALGHSFSAWEVTIKPTCTEKGAQRRDCANCDAFETQEVAATGHDYKAVVTAPTCTDKGYTTYTCANCSDSYQDTYVDALGHSFSAWEVTTKPTCTEKGTERRDCANCDAFETQEVAATGHDYKAVVTAPTCTEKGYTTHTCANCGDSYQDTFVDELGHSFGNWIQTKAPGCETKGEERRDCANCDAFETQEVAATGHDYKAVVTAPTCTEKGYTTHTCTNCSDSYQDTYVDALGHSYGNWIQTKAPTLESEGEERRDCANCDAFETRKLPALTHNYTAVVTAPTCTDKGYTTHTCTNCGDTYKDTYVDALGHAFETYTSNGDATCTADGTKTAKCQRCEVTDTLPDTGSALGHSFSAWEVTTKPTCEAKGEERRDCANCDAFETQEVAATGHDYKAVVTAPTCTEEGYTTYTCANCSDSYQDTFVDALGHSYGNWTQTKAPGCEAKGEERRDCANCDAFETQEVAATGHDYKAVVTAPTCTEKGYTTHTCTNCSDSYQDTYVDALGHSYGNWIQTKAPTLESEGEERRDCANCDAFETRKLPALTHNYTAVVTAPTCTDKGYTTHTCTNCGDTYKDTYVDALGHAFETYTSNGDATCTADGTKTAKCQRCEVTDTLPDTGSALGHSYGNWTQTKAPGCEAKGAQRRDCANCDAFETQEVAATGHDYKAVVTAPTCTEKGYTTHTCANCSDSYQDAYVDALGHSYGNWTQTKAPGCEAKGEERRDCANCDAFETQEVAATGHSFGAWYEVDAATEEQEGLERRDCANCDAYDLRTTSVKTVASIRLQTLPTKLSYVGKKDALDVTGGKVLVTYTDGTTTLMDLTADMVSGFNNALPGSQTLTVTYREKTASYTVEITTLTVTFKNWDGTVLSEKEYLYGDTVAVPADPTRASDKTYSYSFSGWDKAVTLCTGETTYTATYQAAYIDYTVTFLDDDGTVLSTKKYHYGSGITLPGTPEKPADKTYTYTFAGWDKPVVPCAGDTTYTAVYQRHNIEYTVIFQYADGTLIQKKTYHYGDAVAAPADPEPQQEGYTFSGWNKTVTNCTGDATYTAVFATDYPIGDFTKDEKVTNKDVEYLLWHTLFPEDNPIDSPADFTGDGRVTNKDVEYLLWHTLFPEDYPLTNAAVITNTDALPADKKYLSEVN